MKKTKLIIGFFLLFLTITSEIDGTINFINRFYNFEIKDMIDTLNTISDIFKAILPFAYIGAYFYLWNVFDRQIKVLKGKYNSILKDQTLRIQLLNSMLVSNNMNEASMDTVLTHLTKEELMQIGYSEVYIEKQKEGTNKIRLGAEDSTKVKGEDL